MNPVIDWLLDERIPAMRYRTLTELLNESGTDVKVQAAYQATW
jgi:hypothetical protein